MNLKKQVIQKSNEGTTKCVELLNSDCIVFPDGQTLTMIVDDLQTQINNITIRLDCNNIPLSAGTPLHNVNIICI